MLNIVFWKSMDGFGGMQSMNLLKLYANMCVYITCTFSGTEFLSTHLVLS